MTRARRTTVTPEAATAAQKSRRPKAWARLQAEYGDVARAYEALTDATRAAGPLDASTIALLKVTVSIGARSWRTVHAHAKKALAIGVSPGALRHAVLIALPTIGLPAALDALRWMDESIEEAASDGELTTENSELRTENSELKTEGALE